MPDAPATTKTDLPPLPDRVLIVEDDAIIGLALEDALADAGVRNVEISTTTEQALDALRRERPDAIVLDVHLADRDDGWAIAELVKTLGPDSPRIVFSTGAPQDIPDEVAEMGCVLAKPYDIETLIDLLREPKRRGIISRLRGRLR
ncbi:response regulator [Qipengyuania sp. XHP0211]|uniref:response regulator n=1 Tax=Qipengyuania sp. XHP0211 TaxID=3038079 RepID=UPI00241CCA7B|nr:response regulator [Qipengyuania sp. XHP0211]MDG5750333.1 response regulator [Qipengyuania sp. XHP0211]